MSGDREVFLASTGERVYDQPSSRRALRWPQVVSCGIGWLLCRWSARAFFALSVEGEEHIPQSGPVILAPRGSRGARWGPLRVRFSASIGPRSLHRPQYPGSVWREAYGGKYGAPPGRGAAESVFWVRRLGRLPPFASPCGRMALAVAGRTVYSREQEV